MLRGELFDDGELQLITKFMRLAIQLAATSVTSQKVKFLNFMSSLVHWRKRVILPLKETKYFVMLLAFFVMLIILLFIYLV